VTIEADNDSMQINISISDAFTIQRLLKVL